MGETDWHIWALILLREALEDFFAPRDDVYIGADLFLYYREGDPTACKAPDIMVVAGVAKRWRRSFKTWAEKAVLCVIVEITSEKTWPDDLGEKRTLYERLGVKEYFVFDPEARCLKPPLQGFRRKGKRFDALTPATDGSLASKELGLSLHAENAMLRLRDARTGQPLLTRKERADQAQQQLEQERAARENERRRADQERAEKERERRRANALEAELARLKASKRSGRKG